MYCMYIENMYCRLQKKIRNPNDLSQQQNTSQENLDPVSNRHASNITFIHNANSFLHDSAS